MQSGINFSGRGELLFVEFVHRTYRLEPTGPSQADLPAQALGISRGNKLVKESASGHKFLVRMD
jgi:hypothetical protein